MIGYKKKLKRKHKVFNFIWDILFLLFVSFYFRMLPLSKYLNDKNYHFLGTNFIYWFKPDSYHFSLGRSLIDSFLEPLLFIIITMLVFYFLLSVINIKRPYKLLTCILLSIFPIFFNQTMFNYIDTPHLIIFHFIIILTNFIILIKYNTSFDLFNTGSLLLIILSFIILYNNWGKGTFLIIGVFLICLFITYIKNNKAKIGLLSLTLVGSLFIKDFIGLLHLKYLGVSEYQTPLYLLYYIFSFIIIYSIISNYNYFKTANVVRFMFTGFIIYFVLSLFIGRFAVFSLIFGLPILYISLDKVFKTEKPIILIFSILILIAGFNTYMEYKDYKVEMFNQYEIELNKLDPNLPIISLWNKGHMLKYFTNNEVLLKAAPTNNNEKYIKGILIEEKEGIKYLDNITAEDYYLIIHYSNFPSFEYYKNLYNIKISNESILTKAVRNRKTENLKLIKYLYDKEERVWIYKNVH